jgi:UDP-GlcNAc:undecaprenyl-phosphate GlcNAc-1-phosphate transferase
MINNYIQPLILSLALSLILSWLTIKLALKLKILDHPKENRKLHNKPMPLLGGLAIFGSFFVVAFINLKNIKSNTVLPQFIIAMFVGAVILMIGGYMDDKYNLSPSKSIIAPILASLAVIASGLKIDYITNPFGGYLSIGLVLGAIITFLWILGMMYTTKILDGLDGLVTGVTCIGAIIIFFASFQQYFIQPEVAVLALILAGACFGFLFWNFNPAKIFLGESGSLLCGFLLACLAILSKGKIATTLLIMGIPILDLVWVILRRWREGGSIKIADRKHLHHRLIDAGLSHRNAVLVYYFLTALFGGTALFLQSKGKFLALIFLLAIMILVAGFLGRKNVKVISK